MDWFLSTLPGEQITRYERRFERPAPTTTGEGFIRTDAADFLLAIPEGSTLVLFRYHYYLEIPGVGSHTALAPPHSVDGDIELKFLVNGKPPFITGGSVNGTGYSGEPWLTDAPHTHWEHIPIFIHGSAQIDTRFNVVALPAFPITRFGISLAGFQIPTITIKRSLEAAKRKGM